jgi:hypothetical protein
MRGNVALTIDLDFFFHPVLRSTFGVPLNTMQNRQQFNFSQSLWLDEQILVDLISYLRRVRRYSCFHSIEKHNDALYYICNAVETGRLQTPFTLWNLDAHSDLYLNHLDSHYRSVRCIQCEQLPGIADESDWVWALHAIGWLNKYVWIKPSPKFLKFALPELPKSYIKPENRTVLDWLEHNRPGWTWSDAMYDGREPKLLAKSFESLKADRFGNSFHIEVNKLEPNKLPQEGSVSCVTLSRSPGYTSLKADDLYNKIVENSTP